MNMCAQCAKLCGNLPVLLKYGEEELRFCSFECVIVHSANRVCRRLARQKRRIQNLLNSQRVGESARASRAVKN